MRTRTFAALIVALSLAAACGESQTSTTPTPEPYVPTGEAARLRVVALEPEITCDGKTHDVQIWLDDIPREPVERPDVISGAPPVDGVSGFQFKLAFDQSVVRIRDEGDVRLAPGLDALAGSDAHFMAAGPFIDNYAGYAFIGGLNLGIAADIRVVPEDNQPTPLPQPGGLDPFAAGQSILLFEVGVEAIGTGKTEVTLREPQLLSGVKHEYAPVEVESATLAVPGDCAPVPSATPRVTPTATLVVPPTKEPPVVVPVTPVPASGIRDDCPAGWAVAEEDAFSICYPVAAVAAYRAELGPRVTYSISWDTGQVRITDPGERAFNPEGACVGLHLGVPSPQKSEPVTVTWLNGEAAGCAVSGFDGDLRLRAVRVDVQHGDGLVSLSAIYEENPANALTADSIIGTVLLK